MKSVQVRELHSSRLSEIIFYTIYPTLTHQKYPRIECFDSFLKELHVWKSEKIDGYTIFNNIHLYLSYVKQDAKEVSLIIHQQPTFSDDELAFLLELCSREFIQFIKMNRTGFVGDFFI